MIEWLASIEIQGWHLLAAIFGVFATAILGLMGHTLSKRRFKLEEKRFEHEKTLLKRKAEFDAKALLREKQTNIAYQILEAVGRMNSTIDRPTFDKDWWFLTACMYGQSRLISDKGFHIALSNFCDVLWEFDELSSFDGMDEKNTQMFNQKTKKLLQEADRIVQELFTLHSVEIDVPENKGNKNKPSANGVSV